MIKAMLFVHGTWLNAHTPRLGRLYGRPDFQIDFKRLPGLLAEEIGRRSEPALIDLFRSHYFGSFAENYDARDTYAVQRRQAFFAELRAENQFEVEAFAVDYQGRRLRRQDRAPDDDYTPAERCVDVALSVAVMRYAMMPNALDLAVLLVGDADFVPLLQEVRRLGKRAAVVSIEGACASELVDPINQFGVRDFDVIWLNDLLNRIEKWRTRPTRSEPEPADPDGMAGTLLRGRVKTVIRERGYGFITADDGSDYFFHANTLGQGLEFATLTIDLPVMFEVRTGPSPTRAGAARLVCPTSDEDGGGQDEDDGDVPDGAEEGPPEEVGEDAAGNDRDGTRSSDEGEAERE